jgi:hypothetical protein
MYSKADDKTVRQTMYMELLQAPQLETANDHSLHDGFVILPFGAYIAPPD